MKLKGLTVWQRQMLVIITGQVSGNAAVMRKANKALDVLEFPEAEAKTLGLTFRPDGSVTWDRSREDTYDLEIKDVEAAHLVQRLFKEYAGWKGFDHRRVLDLEMKLGLTVEEENDTSNPNEES